GAVGLGLELAHHQPIVPEERSPIDEPQIVARDVRALPPELDACALADAPVRPGVHPFGDGAGAQPERRERAPFDGEHRSSHRLCFHRGICSLVFPSRRGPLRQAAPDRLGSAPCPTLALPSYPPTTASFAGRTGARSTRVASRTGAFK